MQLHSPEARACGVEPGRDAGGRATRVRLADITSAPMRAFHLSWIAFFLCFVAWFGIAPLMAIVRDDLKFTKAAGSGNRSPGG